MSIREGPKRSNNRFPEVKTEHEEHLSSSSKAQIPKTSRGFFTFQQLNSLAIIIIFSATGMITIQELAFVIFSVFYMYFLSKFAFPSHNSSMKPPVFGENNQILGIYVLIGALIGLIFPIGYIFEGIYEGDKEGIKAAAPHIFLLSSQVFMEELTFTGRFSLPIRAFVPVFYNSMRISTILEWLRREIEMGDEEFGGSVWRLRIGKGLAVANLGFWCFNLFGFLLPVYLPRALKRHYGDKEKGLTM